MKFRYEYPRAALTVDNVVFGFDNRILKVLLIRRGIEPFQGCWALPGGFVHVDETLEQAAQRELTEETGLKRIYLEQLHSFSRIDRDPRERVISVAFVALVRRTDHLPCANTDADDAQWFATNELPELAFDHAEIFQKAMERMREKIHRQPIGFELLPSKFTLTQLQMLYEAVIGRELDKRNFRKKLLTFDFLIPLESFNTEESRRPARLYRFDQRKYELLTKKGMIFEL